MTTPSGTPSLAASRAAAVAVAGALAGFVVAGVGGRLAMRLSAQIDRSAHGKLTEAGAVVGEFTLEGTIGFVIFIGLLGAIIGGVLWSLVSPWLPDAGRARRIAAVVVASALGARFAIDGNNIDFRILDPALVHAVLFVVLAGAVGAAAVTMEPRVARRFSDPGPGLRVVSWLLLVAGVTFVVPFGFLFFSEESCGCARPPWLVGLAVFGLAALWLVRFGFSARDRALPSWVRPVGRSLVVVATVSGIAHVAAEIGNFV